jgi:hypothetical protein
MSSATETQGLATALIIDHDHGNRRVPCMFNPNDYTFSKHNNWQSGDKIGSNLGQIQFSSGQPTVLRMQLFFDTYANVKSGSSGGTPQDVRKKYTGKIWSLMKVDPRLAKLGTPQGRPPMVTFQWGKTWTFKAIITDLQEHFTLFLADGTPVRSTMDVTFQQLQDEDWYPSTNPTSGGVGGERVWVVNEGDTLGWIAYKEYGNANLWRLIADANKLTRVRQLTPGMALEVPNVSR